MPTGESDRERQRRSEMYMLVEDGIRWRIFTRVGWIVQNYGRPEDGGSMWPAFKADIRGAVIEPLITLNIIIDCTFDVVFYTDKPKSTEVARIVTHVIWPDQLPKVSQDKLDDIETRLAALEALTSPLSMRDATPQEVAAFGVD